LRLAFLFFLLRPVWEGDRTVIVNFGMGPTQPPAGIPERQWPHLMWQAQLRFICKIERV